MGRSQRAPCRRRLNRTAVTARRAPAHRLVLCLYLAAALIALVAAGACGGRGGASPAASPTEGNEVVAQRIHVEVKRTGGFGGLVTSRSADTDSLPTDDARRLTELVDGLDLEALRHQPESTRSVPDAFQYDIAISRGAENLRLRVRDPDLPAELRSLIHFVIQRT
jgi:hypothetical protein